MVSSCIVNKAREMFILTFLHTKGDALTIAPMMLEGDGGVVQGRSGAAAR